MRPSWSAFARADSSTSSPREVLTRTAVGFIRASAGPSIRWRVAAGEGHVHRHDVRAGQKVVERREGHVQVPLAIRGQAHRIVVDQGRSPPAEPLRDLLADAPHPHDPDRRAPQLVEPLRARAPPPRPHPGVEVGQVPERRHHEHDGVLGDRDRVGPAVDRDGDASCPGAGEVEPVVADAQELDELEPAGRGEDRVVQRARRIPSGSPRRARRRPAPRPARGAARIPAAAGGDRSPRRPARGFGSAASRSRDPAWVLQGRPSAVVGMMVEFEKTVAHYEVVDTFTPG